MKIKLNALDKRLRIKQNINKVNIRRISYSVERKLMKIYPDFFKGKGSDKE